MFAIRPINEGRLEESSMQQIWRADAVVCTFNHMIIALSAGAIAVAWVLLLLQIDPVPTWFYVFAWYPTLVLLDAVTVRLDGGPSVLWRKSAISLFAWSPVIWLVFEAANFRLMNWYYVFLPHSLLERWAGILLSFATVVPALLLAERILGTVGVCRTCKARPVRVRPRDLSAATLLGITIGLLALALPRLFFPLIWGAAFLITDPVVYRLNRPLSLIADLERGDWGRIGRLLLGGLAVGIIWEAYNFWARGKWIYTVPWLEEVKLFEMPPFGFVGFPVFALEAWSMYHLLCALGVAHPLGAHTGLVRRRTVMAGLAALLLSCGILVGMERRTISSTVPRLGDVPGVGESVAARLRAAGVRAVFQLAAADPAVLKAAGLTDQEAGIAISHARLVDLCGIGTKHALTLVSLGINQVCELAARDPEHLTYEIRRHTDAVRPTAAEVRVWIRAARRRCTS
jgi:predicted flap endonuclease-1-like 5' DNA nuclease